MLTKSLNKFYVLIGAAVIVVAAIVFIQSVFASTTGAGVITAVGTDYVTINNGQSPADNIYYATATGATTFLNGTNAFIVGEYITFTGDTDDAGFVRAVSMTVDIPPIPITFNLYQFNGQVGTPYGPSNLVSTGVPPIFVTATNVPGGMSVSPAGVMSGIPTTPGIYTIGLSATDARGTIGTGQITITIFPALVPVTFLTTVTATTGVPFLTTNLVLSGAAPVEVSAIGVPAGMLVSSTGDLSGTPTTAGTYSIKLSGIGFDGNEATGTTMLVVKNVYKNKDDCKKDGWKNFTNPKFKNQGDCVSKFESDENDKKDKKGDEKRDR